jgi:uncharacterized membrane protein YhaH (DUF805 family)
LLQKARECDISNDLLYGLWTTGQFWIIWIFSSLFFATLHYFEFPFFEKYKAFDEPWPWLDNKSAWMKQLRNTLPIVLFNILVITPVFGLANYFSGIPVTHDFSVEGVPTSFKFVA